MVTANRQHGGSFDDESGPWFYGVYNPYGVEMVNTAGNKYNRLYRWTPKRVRDEWVDEDPNHCYALPANHKYVKRCKARAINTGWPVAFLED